MVAHYLNRMFYNLNTVALYDWQTFGEMRSLAREKYGLELQEVHLPGQTLEQGLDVLTIMRRLPSFVSHYCYNLNNQIFIEKKSETKNTLSTINIQHIANSIRTHGTGIMNTTVSVTYQFLKEQFHIFSTFLYDETIKSRLLRNVRSHVESKDQHNSRYPYEEAKSTIDYIKSLGIEDKLTFVDKFRIVITEIGNAIGYVRMIRSGGLLFTSNSIRFVPDLNNIRKVDELIQGEENVFSQDTLTCSKYLDDIIENLYRNFTEGTNYFAMLVEIFKKQYKNEKKRALR